MGFIKPCGIGKFYQPEISKNPAPSSVCANKCTCLCTCLSCSMSCYVQAALSSVDYEDYVRNDSEIKEKMARIKKDLKVMKISEQITDKVYKFIIFTFI